MSANEEIAELARREFEALKSKDIESFVALGANIIGGFGWRTPECRCRNQTYTLEGMIPFFESTDYLDSSGFEELHTWSEGEVGIAWGIVNEEFQRKGQPPEKAKVRITLTFKKDSEGWHQIMYHRDIQPFRENGQYPIELTKAE